MAKIIAITGEAGHGKNTVADIIKEMYFSREDRPYTFTTRSFATTIKEVCAKITGYPLVWFSDREKKSHYISWLGITIRELMQKVGTSLRTGVKDEIFILSEFAKIRPDDLVIFDDLRFLVEAKTVKEFNGTIIKVIRPDYVDPSLSSDGSKSHVSETELKLLTYDHIIVNNRGLPELREQVYSLAQKLRLWEVDN
jgi:nucleoside-triphosphatase THEP1